jgi:uncharacterized glyoxalase superfamily protein PhnB
MTASANLAAQFSRRPRMRHNRSVPPCTVIPVLSYPDPSAAADWLGRVFGFTARLRIANHRIQMRAGEGCFTIAEGQVVPNHSCIVQVRIADVLGHCERARLAGARILTEPTDHDYGERQYNAEDFYGHRWDFTETLRDVEPGELGRNFGKPVAAVFRGSFRQREIA